MFLGKLEVSGRHGYQRVEIMNLCVPVLLTSIRQCDCLLISLPFHETWISCTHSRDITPLGIQQVESVTTSFQFSFCLIPNLLVPFSFSLAILIKCSDEATQGSPLTHGQGRVPSWWGDQGGQSVK